MCTVFSSRKGERKQTTVARCSTWLTPRSCVCFSPISRSRSIKETLVYTCVLITLRCLAMRSFWWGWKESTRDNGREGVRGGAGRFWPLLWMRYCLVVEHSWETSGHVDSRERAHTVLQTQEHIQDVITTPRKKSLFLCVSFSTSLPLPVFSFQHSPFFLSHFLPSFFLSHLYLFCGFTSKRIGGFGVVDFWTAAVCCVADVMGESYRLI